MHHAHHRKAGPAGNTAKPGPNPRPNQHREDTSGRQPGSRQPRRKGDNCHGAGAQVAATSATRCATAAMACAQLAAIAGVVPVRSSASVQRFTAQRRWWPFVARMQAWPHAASAVMVGSGRMLGRTERGNGEAILRSGRINRSEKPYSKVEARSRPATCDPRQVVVIAPRVRGNPRPAACPLAAV